MAKVTNYTGGMRGLTLRASKDDGAAVDTTWVEPGQEVEYDPDLLVGPLPDMGKKLDDGDTDDKDVAIAALRQENETQKATIADLTSQLEAATAPAKK